MLRYPLICLCFLVMLSNCVFESEDEYFNKLAIPDPTNVRGISTVDLTNYNPGDTIDLFGTTSFEFSLKGNHGKIESGTVFLSGSGDSWNFITDDAISSFKIDMGELSNGISVLKLNLITKTGSGSLADVVGAEKFNITMKWVVRVDLSPPTQPMPTLGIVNGFLTLQWAAYTRPNFQSYVVKRELPSGASQTFEIKDTQTACWRDQNYVGGYISAIEYSVSIVSETGTSTSIPIMRTDPINIRFSFNNTDSTFTLKWKPTEFYGTFKNYRFTEGSAREITSLTNINDSTLTYKLSTILFGGDFYIGLKVQSNSEGIPEYPNWNICKLGTPLTFAPVGKIMFNPHLNSLIGVNADKKLLELNAQLEPVRGSQH